MPAIARPLPPNRPLLLPIVTMLTIPRIKPTRAVMPHENGPRIPKTRELMARPLVFSGASELGWLTDGGMPGEVGGRLAANSGKEDNGFHSVVPSNCTMDVPTSRLCAIHCRS